MRSGRPARVRLQLSPRTAAAEWLATTGGSHATLFEKWRKRLEIARPGDIEKFGSAAFDLTQYPGERFEPGDFVGWLFVNEADEQGSFGRRLF